MESVAKKKSQHNINSYVARVNKLTDGIGIRVLKNEFSVHLPEDNPGENLGSGWVIRTAFRIDGKDYGNFGWGTYEIVGYASPRRRYSWSEFKRVAANAVSEEITKMVEDFKNQDETENGQSE